MMDIAANKVAINEIVEDEALLHHTLIEYLSLLPLEHGMSVSLIPRGNVAGY
jgi:hypothetical protein